MNTPEISPNSSDDPQENGFSDKWEEIGYHRILGGFFYNIIFAIVALAYSLILPLVIPYSESLGYYNILTGIFSSIFTFADLGLGSALSRFIAEYRVKDPKKSIEYIRFFIWFQAFSGLIQTTVVSMIGLYGLKNSDLSFMPWMFIWLSIVQYPGWLGVFMEALKGFQQYGKVALAGLLNSMIFQVITLAIGAQLGAYLGNLNPMIGGTLGSAIGLVIGYYIDDFSTVVITARMFAQVLKPMNIRLRDVFLPKFHKEVAIESVKFGLGVMGFTLSFQIIGTIVAFIYSSYLPNYATYIGTLSMLSPIMGMAEQINNMHIGNHRSAVSEAFFNEKPNYAVYILSNGFRTIGELSFFILPLVIIIGPYVVENLFPQYLEIFIHIFVWKLVFSSLFQHSHLMNEVLIGTGNHKFNILVTIGEQLISLTSVIVCIYLRLGIFVLIIPGYFQTAFKQGFGWWFINTRIINLKINVWQNWIAPLGAGIVYFGLFWGIKAFLVQIAPPLVVIIIFVLLGIYILPGIGYFLPLGLLGGYDNHTLEDLERAAELAGPSKIVVFPWRWGARLGCKLSPLHGKFPMEYSGVGEEIADLMRQKREHK
jgi:O-antigen/teichoic acid export membrane protein